jgi:hypothetical protein
MEWGAFRTDRLNRGDHQQFHKRVRFFGFIGAGWAAPDSGLYLDPFQFHETTRANVFIELIGPTHGWICRAFTDLRESLRWFPAANRRRDADMAESTISANAAPMAKSVGGFWTPWAITGNATLLGNHVANRCLARDIKLQFNDAG